MAQPQESTVAVMIDCDNVAPEIVDFALLMAAQAGRVTLRRGYGNRTTLGNSWQEALVRQAFTPCLQFQYAAKKNTSDIALALDALEALFDQRADIFCLVTSDSDFAYLCRKLRERGATVLIVGEAKPPMLCAMPAISSSSGPPKKPHRQSRQIFRSRRTQLTTVTKPRPPAAHLFRSVAHGSSSRLSHCLPVARQRVRLASTP